MANLLTIVRTALVFMIVAVWANSENQLPVWLGVFTVLALAAAIALDAVDGWVARRLNEDSQSGALVDIAGDRVVELCLWVFFASWRDGTGQALVPLWVPMVVVARTVITDLVRSVAFQQGRTAFGATSMHEARWARELTSARWSRGGYGILKAVCFCVLGLVLVQGGGLAADGSNTMISLGADLLVYITVGFCVLRALPVLMEARLYRVSPPDPAPAAAFSDHSGR